jgi:hypothetical protein
MFPQLIYQNIFNCLDYIISNESVIMKHELSRVEEEEVAYFTVLPHHLWKDRESHENSIVMAIL